MSKDKKALENLIAILGYNQYFTDAQIKAVVADGVVTLTGTVCDWKQKEMIEALARKNDGVVKVDNQLEIVEPAVESLTELEVINTANRQMIPAVQDALFAHPSLNAAAVGIVAAKRPGVFYLKGFVASEADWQAAEAAANTAKGIRYVINDLTVDATKVAEFAVADATEKAAPSIGLMEKYAVSGRNSILLTEVKEALRMHPSLNATGIEVTADATEVGIFVLKGTVPTAADKLAAEVTARKVNGVKYIDSRLEVVA